MCTFRLDGCDRFQPIADIGSIEQSSVMRAICTLLLVAVSATGCSDERSMGSRQTMSGEEFARTFVWSRVPPDGWASLPTLVIAKKDGLYPLAPDVEIGLTCLKGGSLRVFGNNYHQATDVSGPSQTTARFGLRNKSVSLSGEPIWEHGDYSKEAHFILRPTAEQLSKFVDGEWFEVVSIYPDGSGTVRFPATPKTLALPFLKDCEGLRQVN